MVEVGDYLRPLMLKDLRTQCRARGLNPGGSRDALCERVSEHMTATQDFTIFADATPSQNFSGGGGGGGTSLASLDEPAHANNYSRPNGQNVGNHITDRPSSRVLAPPGGQSQVFFGEEPPRQAQMPVQQRQESAYDDRHYQPALADVSNQGSAGYGGRESQAAMSPKAAPACNSQPGSPSGGHFTGHGMSGGHGGREVNNYSRSEGQNVGNFLSDRPSSRVLAPPGGASQVTFG
mmetsp:Transcript_15991/g.48025  ORF Transcript_15991/g.48025 Transcript_15991/m.48025 type:complete len:235 (-) Transcript_15991:382-1086(-)|eukprot:CAMPEP_0206147146 /NCGR_PEP_ID=MMETSP1473-20131121/32565_1 /ASSEMBLY_ACC=CAM_ASM_001109 /TAXON_ID=1461547 /ORGANISM="Stichococcus sp, Strain RCC1054" /LENGTH=234 /DNA_ID=CAMNT_0053543979 /DNA_START=99 /DNA_END=803 /DNA_ORIENTATION=-